jgi:hypothetical protein
MRAFALLPLLVLAACTGTAEADEKAAAEAAKANLKLETGQWAVASEVTDVRALDEGAAVLKAKAGDKANGAACLSPADAAQPQPSFFLGQDAGSCTYGTFYMSRGRIVASANCKREGLDGEIRVSLDGSYTATSFDLQRQTQSALVSDGDIAITETVKGTRAASACPA